MGEGLGVLFWIVIFMLIIGGTAVFFLFKPSFENTLSDTHNKMAPIVIYTNMTNKDIANFYKRTDSEKQMAEIDMHYYCVYECSNKSYNINKYYMENNKLVCVCTRG
jgi:hypothetical protein